MSDIKRKHLGKGLLQLFSTLFAIWFLIWQVTPVLVDNIPALAHFGKVAEENDIMPGMLFYNDVPVTADAAISNSNTVRFLPHGGKKFD